MKTVTVHLESVSPYSQSRQHDTEKLPKELADDYDARTWREKCSTNADGEIVIPAMAFKQCLDAAAKMMSRQIPGKSKQTYTKHFRAGVLCEDDVPIGVKKDDVPSITISAHSNGVRGSGTRVRRRFPQVPEWKGTARFVVLDDTIGKEVFEETMADAGRFIGVGRFRPENGGLNGRFRPVRFDWN